MEDLSEKEQLDAIRAWWSEYGASVMGGIAVAIVGVVGWNTWQGGIRDAQIEASTLYEDVMEAAARDNLEAADEAAAMLFSEHPATAYAAQARLAMARMYMDNGRDQDAADVLSALIDQDPGREIALVGRYRLAKILLYQDKAQEVVDLVQGQTESAFDARFNELLGDAFAALGSYAEAEAAYIAALNDDPRARTVDVEIIQLKINDLPALDEAPSIDEEADAAAPSTDDVELPEAVDGAVEKMEETAGSSAGETASGETE